MILINKFILNEYEFISSNIFEGNSEYTIKIKDIISIIEIEKLYESKKIYPFLWYNKGLRGTCLISSIEIENYKKENNCVFKIKILEVL